MTSPGEHGEPVSGGHGGTGQTAAGQRRTAVLVATTMAWGLALLGLLAYFMAPETTLPHPWVAAGVLLLAVVGAAVADVMLRRLPPAPGASPGQAWARVNAVQVARLAVLEAPGVIALVLMFLTPEPSWVTYATGGLPALLLIVVLGLPRAALLRRYEEQLQVPAGTLAR